MREGDRTIFRTLLACTLVLAAALGARAASDGWELKERKTTLVGGYVGPTSNDYDSIHLDPGTKALIVQPVGGGATPADVNLKQVGGSPALTGGIAGSQGTGGLTADGANLSAENPTLMAGSDGAKVRDIATTNKGEVAVVMTSTTLLASSAKVGVVTSDQTTPGTTDHVSPISGQNGIDGGSGASTAATTRTILSTDTQIQGRAANGAAASGNPVLVAYVDSTSITRTSRSDASGRARAAWGDQPTYWVNVTSAITAATAPTDIFCITGSDTATVRVFIFQILCGKTAAQTQPQLGTPSITFVKRSTRDSNDTKVTQTPIAADSSRPAATASVFHYTSNPGSLGTLVGTLGISYSLIPALSSAPLSITFGANSPIAPGQTQSSVTECSGTLKGSGECLCCNLAGQTLTGFQFSYAVGWTETSD